MTKNLGKYKVTLHIQGMESSFNCDDPKPTEEAWNKNKKLFIIQENGKKYFYDLSKYHTMVIEENEK
ncbi:MAG TPA: hypothetical protein VJ438_01515 [Candidatus Nanoarchaeia archaeon]|nr:hypothetical protein [Candidatus Nanoarchaeia archaeon]